MDTNQNANMDTNQNVNLIDMLRQLLKQKEELDCRIKEFVAERKLVELIQAEREVGAQLAEAFRKRGDTPEVASLLAVLAAKDAEWLGLLNAIPVADEQPQE